MSNFEVMVTVTEIKESSIGWHTGTMLRPSRVPRASGLILERYALPEYLAFMLSGESRASYKRMMRMEEGKFSSQI